MKSSTPVVLNQIPTYTSLPHASQTPKTQYSPKWTLQQSLKPSSPWIRPIWLGGFIIHSVNWAKNVVFPDSIPGLPAPSAPIQSVLKWCWMDFFSAPQIRCPLFTAVALLHSSVRLPSPAQRSYPFRDSPQLSTPFPSAPCWTFRTLGLTGFVKNSTLRVSSFLLCCSLSQICKHNSKSPTLKINIPGHILPEWPLCTDLCAAREKSAGPHFLCMCNPCGSNILKLPSKCVSSCQTWECITGSAQLPVCSASPQCVMRGAGAAFLSSPVTGHCLHALACPSSACRPWWFLTLLVYTSGLVEPIHSCCCTQLFTEFAFLCLTHLWVWDSYF